MALLYYVALVYLSVRFVVNFFYVTRNLAVGKGRQARKAENLTAIYEQTV
jgi:hypothetical protein